MKLHIDLKENGYDIILEHGALHHVSDYVNLERKVMIITDSGVPTQYAKILSEQCRESYIHIVEQGEDSKSFEVYKEICEDML
ncbi:MAG: 3-dehydroquinate synthase, partial [Longicatena sp.]